MLPTGCRRTVPVPGHFGPCLPQSRFSRQVGAKVARTGATATPSECFSLRGLHHRGGRIRFRGFPEARRSAGKTNCPRGSGVERFLGKEGVSGSNPVVGSTTHT